MEHMDCHFLIVFIYFYNFLYNFDFCGFGLIIIWEIVMLIVMIEQFFNLKTLLWLLVSYQFKLYKKNKNQKNPVLEKNYKKTNTMQLIYIRV